MGLLRSVVGAGCAGLLALTVWGLVDPPDYRSEFDMTPLSYAAALDGMEAEWKAHGATPTFVVNANGIYASAISYSWPERLTRVAYRDNWILALAAYADPLVAAMGLKKDGHLFGRFESFRYERAFRRGFGICSQNAIGFADLLHRRYGLDAYVVGLDGHVVTQVVTEGGTLMADPSIGVTLPYALKHAEQHPEEVGPVYAAAGYPGLARTWDSNGNYMAPNPGAAAYAGRSSWKQEAIRYFELLSDWMIWLIPAAGLFLVLKPRSRARG